MKILLAIEDLRTGGAQVFGMRLAQALHERGHQVYLYSHYPTYINHDLVRQLAPNVPVLAFDLGLPGLDWLSRKVQGALRRLGKPFPAREQLVEWHLRRTLERLEIEVLNSHMIKSDYVAASAAVAAHPPVPLVITMHGCYEEFLHKASEPEVTLHSRQALRRAAGMVYLTEKNLEIFSVQGVRPLADLPHAQIYNGFAGKFSTYLPERAQLGIGAQDMVFGMVARGIEQKGWVYAIRSFEALSAQYSHIHLVLVGSSEYLDQLRAAHPHPRVHFVGFAANPIDWVRLFDVGLLPSYFPSESLPNSIAEYLFCGIPVIATSIGEIPRMLAVPGYTELAGQLIAQNGRALTNPEELTQAMKAYLTQPQLLASHKVLSQQCFDKFRMERCVAAYEKLFIEVQVPIIE
jgi:glycosyltransferase involved in cell wall biosynthesis